MANLETFGFDDNFLPDSLEIDCPICNKAIEIPLEREENFIICPHCDSKIEIESS